MNDEIKKMISSGDPKVRENDIELLQYEIETMGIGQWSNTRANSFIKDISSEIVIRLLSAINPGKKAFLVSLLTGVKCSDFDYETLVYLEILCPSIVIAGGIVLLPPFPITLCPQSADDSLVKCYRFINQAGYIYVGNGHDGSDYILDVRSGKVSWHDFGELYSLFQDNKSITLTATTQSIGKYLNSFFS